MASQTFELVTPERLEKSVEAELVAVPGAEGDFGVLPGHAPTITALRPGVVSVFASMGGASEDIFVSGGFAEITDERVVVLADSAKAVSEISSDDAQAALTEAQAAVSAASSDGEAMVAAQQLAVAEAMVRAKA
ncbi:MAG: ATP synthase F1 subunit epsilon [Candidatus Puniceispirillales bacterium]